MHRFPDIMTTHHRELPARRLGAAAITRRATEVALLMRTIFPRYTWHFDETSGDPAIPERQRLEVRIGGAGTDLFFTNGELRTYTDAAPGETRRCETDHRLQDALRRLLE